MNFSLWKVGLLVSSMLGMVFCGSPVQAEILSQTLTITDGEGDRVSLQVDSSRSNFANFYNACMHASSLLPQKGVVCSKYEWDPQQESHNVFFVEDLNLANLPNTVVFIPWESLGVADQVTLLNANGVVVGVYTVYTPDHIRFFQRTTGRPLEDFRWINSDDPLTEVYESTVQIVR